MRILLGGSCYEDLVMRILVMRILFMRILFVGSFRRYC